MLKRKEASLTYSEIKTISQFQVGHESFQISEKKKLFHTENYYLIRKEKTHR